MARRSKETIEQDQGAILEQVYKAHTVGIREQGFPTKEVTESLLRPERAPFPSPMPPGAGEAHPRRTDLQALVNQGKMETRVKREWDTKGIRGRDFGGAVSMQRKRAYYKLSQDQFVSMRTQDLQHLGGAGPARAPLGVHKPVRDEWDAGTTDEEMIEDRKQRAEGTREAWDAHHAMYAETYANRGGLGRSFPAM